MSSVHFEATVASTEETTSLPEGKLAIVQCDADFTIEFWNPLTRAYDPSMTVTAPGGILGVPHAKARITGPASVRIISSF